MVRAWFCYIIVLFMKKNIANIITLSRIVGTLCLLPLEVFSLPFMIIYIWCGFSDILDGFLARKLHTSSSLGSKLDTVSDLTLYSVMMIKILPYLHKYLPPYMWLYIYLVLAIRGLIYIYIFIRDKKLNSRHTILNKITSVLMFFLYFLVRTRYLVYYSWLILVISYCANAEEIYHIFKHKAG